MPSLGMWPFSRQLCVGSPPGVWVCSTDMLLTVPSAPGESVPALPPAPTLAQHRGQSQQCSWLSLGHAPIRDAQALLTLLWLGASIMPAASGRGWLLLSPPLPWAQFSGSCAQCGYVCCPRGHWSLLLSPGIDWDGFQGVRVIAVPGSQAYARNHGVYLADEQVRSSSPFKGHPSEAQGSPPLWSFGC